MKRLKAKRIGYNRNGEKIALCTGSVWILTENYSNGRTVKTWKCIVECSEEQALEVFTRRICKENP